MKLTSISEAIRQVTAASGAETRTYIGGCSGEPLALRDAFTSDPDLAAGLTALGIWIPGVNRTDWSSFHSSGKSETIFLSAELRSGFEAGRIAFRLLPYTQAWPWLKTTPLDLAVVMVTPPDRDGFVSLGVSADFSIAALERPGVTAIGLVNPQLAAPLDSPKIRASRFAVLADADSPLAELAPVDLPASFKAIADNIAGLIEDGDTLQFGLGNVQQAVLAALASHRDLNIHSGMISDPVIDLVDAGALDRDWASVTTGTAIGTQRLYTAMHGLKGIRFAPVGETHAIDELAELPRLKAINSAIEVDLFGQANAEFIAGKQVSGTGGLVDFLRGAALSRGGRGILALASTAKGGRVSRIVPALAANATSIARADVATVVTEHGVADLRGLDLDARARAMIDIADPAFRAQLSDDWNRLRSAM